MKRLRTGFIPGWGRDLGLTEAHTGTELVGEVDHYCNLVLLYAVRMYLLLTYAEKFLSS